MRRRLIPIAACLLIAACAAIFFAGSPAFSGSPSADTPLPARTAILPPNGLLQEGDWVFRHGTATDSRLIRELSRSRFSHIGIVVQTQPEVWIAHATTDDDPAHPNQVLLTPLAEFATPQPKPAAPSASPPVPNSPTTAPSSCSTLCAPKNPPSIRPGNISTWPYFAANTSSPKPSPKATSNGSPSSPPKPPPMPAKAASPAAKCFQVASFRFEAT